MKRTTILMLLCITLFFSCDDVKKEEPVKPINLSNLKVLDRGNFVLYFGTNETNPFLLNSRNQVNADNMLTTLVDQLNAMFSLPRDIPITFRSIGEANAFYNPQTKSIEFGLEFVKTFYDVFGKYYSTAAERWEAARYTTFFFLFHEIGHAMVDMYGITVHGEEEDAVDNFGVYLLTQGFSDGIQASLHASDYFKAYADYQAELQLKYLPVQDEHSLDAKRQYNVLCKVYGTEPAKYVHLITRGFLSEDKAAFCQDAALKNIANWNKDLQKWIK
jgi:hypothetical protein